MRISQIRHPTVGICQKSMRLANNKKNISYARIDNLIEEVHKTIEAEQRAEVLNFLMGLRLRVHNMIDECIRFKLMAMKSQGNNKTTGR
jgi:transcriptional regulator NrdR family protein